MPSSLIIRVSAVALGLAGGGVYAASQGLLPMPSGGADASQPVASTAGDLLPPASAAPVTAAAAATDGPLPLALAVAMAPAMSEPQVDPVVEVALTEEAAAPDLRDLAAMGDGPTPDAAPARIPDAAAVTSEDPQLSPLGLPCGLTVDATAQPAAMVALDILSPCQPDTTVTVEHSGLTITARTDALGLLTLDIPAFETPAFFTVRMGDGTEDSLLVPLADLRAYDRIGVSWAGHAALSLHAMEFGARFGEEGHVWAETPRTPAAALDGTGGFLTQLGDPTMDDPMLAQVYTLPRDTLSEGDSVRLSLDAEITAANCGDPAEARTLRAEAAGRVEVTPLTFTHPGCDAVGDFLVLQNLLGDVRLASN
ncbi:hypothetical protein [[Roseibacterium] beibuensis]